MPPHQPHQPVGVVDPDPRVLPLSRDGALEARLERIDLRIAGVQGVCSRLERQLGEVVELLRELRGEASAERG